MTDYPHHGGGGGDGVMRRQGGQGGQGGDKRLTILHFQFSIYDSSFSPSISLDTS